MEQQKRSRAEDSRALLEHELRAFLGEDPRKPLAPFVQLVKEHGELELCFRGNSKREPHISIYSNNHVIFSVCTSGKIIVSFHHARYCENWEEYFDILTETYRFNGSKDRRDARNHLDIGALTRPLSGRQPLSYAQVNSLYETVLKPMFRVYFEAAGKRGVPDYFKQGDLVNPRGKTEKMRQQEIYHAFTSLRDGYFFYDLEFAQRHGSRSEQRNDASNNKPDMQAVRFNAQGRPEKLVFVEVKSTAHAMEGSSGLAEHFRKMRRYEKLEARRREACQIMNQYAKLGLRGLSEQKHFSYDDFSSLGLEILLIFTDEAMKRWESRAFDSERVQFTQIPYPKDPAIRLYSF